MNIEKKEYIECIRQDEKACTVKGELFSYQKLLRKCEYLRKKCKKNYLYLIPYFFARKRFIRLSCKYGFSIPYYVFGPGLSIAHMGTIVVSCNAKIGRNCRIHEGVTIGATNGSSKAPIIGNNVFIASGAKIIGDISIADDVAIGANAVVVKSILEKGTTWGGVPARKISNNSSRSNLSKALFADEEE